MDDDHAIRPICYMVMPFRRKKTAEPRGKGAPSEIDCDALWEKAFRPAIEGMGFVAIRGDFDPTSVIVKTMLERLTLADLVLADVTLPNGNVYYEIGLRHVARKTDCVLLAAEWSIPLFDINQFTSIRYPLSESDVTDADAAAIRQKIQAQVPDLRKVATPYHELMAGGLDRMTKSAFQEMATRLSQFQARIRETRLVPGREERKAAAALLRAEFGGSALEIPEVATELLCLVRDELGWAETVAFVDALPGQVRDLPFMREQKLLALGNSGDPLAAIAQLEQLVREHGDSPERQGLLGGRYKRLWRTAREQRVESGEPEPAVSETRYLEKAIDHYTRGMELDLNEYYCSCNLPQLLRARGSEGDTERAGAIDHLVIAACRRSMNLGTSDEWLPQTLLGAAFRAGDAAEVERLTRQIQIEGAERWKLHSTLNDLADSVGAADENVRAKLASSYEKLAAMVGV